jgi:quinol monooxygenase YgiN
MIHIIWEFQVDPAHIAEFEKNYNTQGAWATLFNQSENYHGTTLLRDNNIFSRYLTINQWDNFVAFEDFKAKHFKAYNDLDLACEKLTLSENKIGIFDLVE